MAETGDEKGKKKESEAARSKRLDAMRERLYSRGKPPPSAHGRSALPDEPQEVSRGWQTPSAEEVTSDQRTDTNSILPDRAKGAADYVEKISSNVLGTFMTKMKGRSRHSYRMGIIIAGIAFFLLMLVVSGAFLLFGTHTISGSNIDLEIKGPFAIGGGEEIPLQITIANNNTVPIESATLIIDYPPGTQSAEDQGRELFSERTQLNQLDSGEVMNVSARAIVFGEENEEKTITAAIEYRVRGSNATFFKEAEPLTFKISSSPVVLSVDGVEQIASGQEVRLDLTISSNAPSTLSDVLVTAEYPFGFEFDSSEPSPAAGQNTWLLSALEPETEETITLRGILSGGQDDEKVLRFSVGVPNERDRFSLASVFTTQTHEITIEQPFLDIGVRINGEQADEVVVAPGSPAQVSITLENILSDTLFDGEIDVRLGGNALDESNVSASLGFYDSTSNTISWDATRVRSLDEIQPGRSAVVSFTLTPQVGADILRTPQITLDVTARGQRVFENRVPQELSGAISRTVKVESTVELNAQGLYSVGSFTNTGPMPPRAEAVTTYTIAASVVNGSNAVTDAVVEMPLPPYVTWLDLVATGAQFSYNSASRIATWEVGDLAAGEGRETAFQVSFLPSISQVGQAPTLIGEQRFRATDRFTGTTIRTSRPAITTRLFSDPDTDAQNGEVQPAQ